MKDENIKIKKFDIKEYPNTNMFALVFEGYNCCDSIIAGKCNMLEDDYQIMLQRKFNGSMWNREVWFHNENDAINAKDYIQSLMLIKRMTNVTR